MKIYISADIEGVAGISHRDETDPHGPKEYAAAQKLMTLEVAAACEAALDSGAKEVWVKDAHWTGRNIIPELLPLNTKLIRGWSGHPYSMLQELDHSFAAVMMIGYHSRAGSGGNPLAHTMSGRLFAEMKLNSRALSEFTLHSYAAALENVPVVFLSGDHELCQEARAFNETIETVATGEGHGPSMICMHPKTAHEAIRQGVARAMKKDLRMMVKAPPERCEMEIRFKSASDAYSNSFYPGASLKSDHVVQFTTSSYFEVLRLLKFMR